MTRRDVLKNTGAVLAGAVVPFRHPARAVVPPPPAGGAVERLNRFPGSVQEFLLGRLRASKRLADGRRDGLRTKSDAERYVREARANAARCFGPLPPRGPLQARVTGSLERDAYRVEKVIFESRPGFLVTANLYLPRGPGRKPAVVGTCGHWPDGKAALQYQAFSQGLARQGYVVLTFDPIGQGERLQYPDGMLRGTLPPGGVSEHLRAGAQQQLVGEFLGTWMAWDGIRALDYLLTRPEVDPARVGLTGNSGGGTQAAWLCALDRRWAMAAPATFITSFLHNLENELPADPEQCPPGAVALGLDQWDFLAAMAPRPIVLLGVEKDFFDVRGLEEAYARLRRLYGLLGREEDVRLFIDDDYHNYTRGHRAAVYDFFNRAAGLGPPAAEPELPMEKPEDLWCTPRGQVAGLASRPVHAFTAERSRALQKERPALDGAGLKTALREVLRLEEPDASPHYRILQPADSRHYPRPHAGNYAIEADGRVLAVAYRLSDTPLFSRPPRVGGRALLYVSHESADCELRESPFLAGLCRAGGETAVFACDVRGAGELAPRPIYPHKDGVKSWVDILHASQGILLDRPYLGQKTADVLRVIRWLADCGHAEVHLAADGWGSLPALFAAVLSDRVARVTLRRALAGYAEVAEAKEYDWPSWTFPSGVLRRFDLGDCRRALAAKDLRIVEPWEPSRTAP